MLCCTLLVVDGELDKKERSIRGTPTRATASKMLSLRALMAIVILVVGITIAVIAFLPTYLIGVKALNSSILDIGRLLAFRAREKAELYFAPTRLMADTVHRLTYLGALKWDQVNITKKALCDLAVRSAGSLAGIHFSLTNETYLCYFRFGSVWVGDTMGTSDLSIRVVDRTTYEPSTRVTMPPQYERHSVIRNFYSLYLHQVAKAEFNVQRAYGWVPGVSPGIDAVQIVIAAHLVDATNTPYGVYFSGISPADVRAAFLATIGLRPGGRAAIVSSSDRHMVSNSWLEDNEVHLAAYFNVSSLGDNRMKAKRLSDMRDPLMMTISSHYGETLFQGDEFVEDTVSLDRFGGTVIVHWGPIRDSAGLDLRLILAMPVIDFVGEVLEQRLTTIILLAVGGVALMVVGVVATSLLMRPLRVLQKSMRDAAMLKDADSATKVPKTFLTDINELAECYNTMCEELARVKQFVPQSLMGPAGMDGTSVGSLLSGPGESRNPLGGSKEQNEHASGLRDALDAAELGPHDGLAASGLQEMQHPSEAVGVGEDDDGDHDKRSTAVQRRALQAENNQFTTRVSTVVYVTSGELPTCSGKERLSDVVGLLLDVVVDAALKHSGVIETMDPCGIVVTFNAHVPCRRHQNCAARFALAIRDRLPPGFYVAADTTTCFVGNVGAHGRSARVVLGEAVDVTKRLPSLMRDLLETTVLFTDRAASQVTVAAFSPTDRVGLAWPQKGPTKELGLCALDDPHGDAFTTAFGLMCRGLVEEAESRLRLELAMGDISPIVERRLKRLLAACDKMWSLGAMKGAGRPAAATYLRTEVCPWDAMGEAVARDRGSEPLDDTVSTLRHSPVSTSMVPVNSPQNGHHILPVNNSSLVQVLSGGYSPGNDSSLGDEACGLPEVKAVDGTVWRRSRLAVGGSPEAKLYRAQLVTGISRSFRNGDGGGHGHDVCALLAMDLSGQARPLAVLAAQVDACIALPPHPNVVGVFSRGSDIDHFYIFSEYVVGTALRTLIDAHGAVPPAVALRLIVGAAKGLQHLHAHRIVHGNLKPQSILVAVDGTVKVSDFHVELATTSSSGHAGVLEMTSLGNDSAQASSSPPATRLGDSSSKAHGGGGESSPCASPRATAWYLSPEAARGECVSAAADVWSLGIIALELLSGQLPWTAEQRCGNNQRRFLRALGTSVTVVPTASTPISRPVAEALACCVAREPSARSLSALIALGDTAP